MVSPLQSLIAQPPGTQGNAAQDISSILGVINNFRNTNQNARQLDMQEQQLVQQKQNEARLRELRDGITHATVAISIPKKQGITPEQADQQQLQFLGMRADALDASGDRSSEHTRALMAMPYEQRQVALLNVAADLYSQLPGGEEELISLLDGVGGKSIPANIQNRKDLLDQLPVDEDGNLLPVDQMTAQQKAVAIEAGLLPRAMGSAAQTIADRGTAEQVGDSEATIEDRVTRAREEAENATGQVKEYFNQLANIESNISNYNEAIRLIDEGADTGVIARRLPSVRAASQKLENVANRLGLDVIGNTTFGALSQDEREFAVDTALPTNLQGPELRQWLVEKQAAQQKLADYIDGAIQFLSVPGNTLADLQATNPRQNARSGGQSSQQAPNTFTSRSGVSFTVED